VRIALTYLALGFVVFRSFASAAAGSSVMTSRSSFGPRFLGLLAFLGIFPRATVVLLKVPLPGLEPGRLWESPACKAGLSANSSTGAFVSAVQARWM
jgi:hypothetical protein